jgi:hypothetical protein
LGERLLKLLDMEFAAARLGLGLPASPDEDSPNPYFNQNVLRDFARQSKNGRDG